MSGNDIVSSTSDAGLVLRWPWLTLLMMLVLLASHGWVVWQTGSEGPFDATALTALGANVAPLSATGDHVRLLTSLFLHESWGHLLQNLVVLLIVGATLESLVSRGVWLFTYVAGGLFAAWMSAVWHFDYSATSLLGNVRQVIHVSVGASGAILALAGAELAMALSAWVRRDEPKRQSSLLRGALIVPVMTLGTGLLDSGIDNAAHFAGFGFGLLTGGVVAVWAGPAHRVWASMTTLAALAIIGWVGWAGTVHVQAHPEREALRQLALDTQEKELAALRHAHRLESEQEHLPPAATPDEARGIVIDVPFVGRIVTAQQPGRVYLLKNYDEAEVFEYDLEARRLVSVSLRRPYPPGKVWGCPGEPCHGIGVSDMALVPEQPGKAFFSNLVPGEVSRVDMMTGETEFSVRTGSFPVRLIAHRGRLYVHDMWDATLTVLNAQNGEVIRTFALDGVKGQPYFWTHGNTMAVSQDGKQLYLISRTGQAHMLDLETHTLRAWESLALVDAQPAYPDTARVVRRIGTDGRGKVWMLHPDGVSYPDDQVSLRRIHYKVHHTGAPTRTNVRDAFVDADGEQGLILFIAGNYVLASSAHTGQLLRVYPLAFPAHTVLVLDVLDNRRFYVAGREGVQIFDVDKALRVDPIATQYREVLERERVQGLRQRW